MKVNVVTVHLCSCLISLGAVDIEDFTCVQSVFKKRRAAYIVSGLRLIAEVLMSQTESCEKMVTAISTFSDYCGPVSAKARTG